MFYKTSQMISDYLLNKKILCLLIAINLSFVFSASISGKVLDKKTQEILIGANIFIEVDDQIMGSATDVNGLYRIENVPDGYFDLFSA